MENEKMQDIQVLVEEKADQLKERIEKKNELIETCLKRIESYQEKIKEYKEEIQKDETRVKNEMLAMIPPEKYTKSKTQFSYTFPSGKLIKKKEQKLIKLIDDVDMNSIDKEYIKIKKAIDWANLKKELVEKYDKVVNKYTGEVVDYCKIEVKKEEIQLKI